MAKTNRIDIWTNTGKSGVGTNYQPRVDGEGRFIVATEATAPLHMAGLNIPAHDYVGLGYTGDNLTTVTYKTGGSGGTTVATLTLAYSGSTLTSVTKT